LKRIACLFLGLALIGKSDCQSLNLSVQDTLLRLYNDNNYRGIYNLGSPEWKSRHDTAGVSGWLNWMHGQTGQILSSTIVSDTGKFHVIRWNGERKVTGFMFMPGDNGQFNDFYFTSFKVALSAAELQQVHSDNPLVTPMDSSIHRIVAAFMVYNKPVGVSIGIIKNGKSYTYNYGTVDKDARTLPTAASFYEIGSIIKTFTSLMLAKAVLDHKVSLQDDVRKYLDGDYSNLQYEGQPLRLVHLASYTSALPAYQILRPFDDSTPQSAAAFFKTYSIPAFLDDLKKVKLDTLPGTRYTYSTAGLNLLAYILSRVYNKSFPELIHEMITGPMRMRETKLYLSPAEHKRFPKGYDSKGAGQPDIYGPLDSLDLLHSTVNDMLIYLGQQIEDKDPAIQLSHQEFSSAPHNEAGLGWFLYQTPQGKAIGKGGNSVHMSCRAWAVPEKKIGMVCFTNSNQMDWGDLVDDIMAVLAKN
jgi:D-alanyl-D-alanine-carboxypeptidase/D-alanyl-D-alanine-endopeptidase